VLQNLRINLTNLMLLKHNHLTEMYSTSLIYEYNKIKKGELK
jgi:hypothetical protein